MNEKEQEQQIIKQYKQDEKTMVLVFAQWCINHNLDAEQLYQKAYPSQVKNQILQNALESTVPLEEAEEITTTALLNVLSVFGNDELAFVIAEEEEKLKHQK
ncbi:hypothetical protein MUN89_12650 [Halobacillus salinarum]|uniref:YxiS n=1 Tax=Halobacillus salinarum TaxID=2932257 RepID=A0ABY4EFZ2_9BACI|nr:hypothetical protein [Halobacillus salinarum]UOQ42813.1 hypothetical protein MUN89_12650 [Halobacillus salinarum]